MRFLLDADMARSCAGVLRDLGHDVSDVRDIGLGSASDDAIPRLEKAGVDGALVILEADTIRIRRAR